MGWRTLLGLPLAGAIVMFLFLFMAGAIRTDEVPVLGKALPKVNMPAVTPDTPVERPKPIPPTDITPPPPPEPTPPGSVDPTFDGGRPVPPGPGESEVTFVPLDVEVTPVVQVAPTNWEGCIDEEGETHRVRLLFDISPQGETANIEVIDSTDSCYERSAVRALRQWRYNPKVVNGEPVWQYGRQATVEFQS